MRKYRGSLARQFAKGAANLAWPLLGAWYRDLYRRRYRSAVDRPTFAQREILPLVSERVQRFLRDAPEHIQREYLSSAAWSDAAVVSRYASQRQTESHRVVPLIEYGTRYDLVASHYYPLAIAFQGLPKVPVYDYGCGDGRLCGMLNSWTYWGIDSNAASVADCRTRYPHAQFSHLPSLKELPSIEPMPLESIGVLAWVLCHLLRSETEELLTWCVQHHRWIVIAESLKSSDLRVMERNEYLGEAPTDWNFHRMLTERGAKLTSLYWHPVLVNDRFHDGHALATSVYQVSH